MIAWAEVNGATLRYEFRNNRPNNPTVVLVHEGMGMLESWDEALPYFEEAFNVLRYDQRGFGMSEKTDQFTMDVLVEDLLALMEFVGIAGPVYLVSCGFGGGLVLSFTIKHPERVTGVFVSSPTGGRSPTHEFSRELEIRAEIVEKGGTRGLESRVLPNSYQEILRENLDRYRKFRLRWLSNSPRQLANLFRISSKLYLVPMLPSISTPVVIAGCKHDTRSPPAEMANLAAMIPNGRFVEIDSGHFACVQTPRLFAETAVRLLGQVIN